MHQHDCKHCKENFGCGESALTCFKTEIVCKDCFWKREVPERLFALAFSALLTIAVFQIIAEASK